jgi:hypothetical protein
VLEKHIEPARRRGEASVDVLVRQVHSNELGLSQKYAIVMAALDSEPF